VRNVKIATIEKHAGIERAKSFGRRRRLLLIRKGRDADGRGAWFKERLDNGPGRDTRAATCTTALPLSHNREWSGGADAIPGNGGPFGPPATIGKKGLRV